MSDSIQQSLLAKGYFPKELPTAFTSDNFGTHSTAILAEWKAAGLYSIKAAKDFQKIGGKRFRGRYSYKSPFEKSA